MTKHKKTLKFLSTSFGKVAKGTGYAIGKMVTFTKEVIIGIKATEDTPETELYITFLL